MLGELGEGGRTTGMVTVYELLENVQLLENVRDDGVAGELGREVIPAKSEVAAVAIWSAGAIASRGALEEARCDTEQSKAEGKIVESARENYLSFARSGLSVAMSDAFAVEAMQVGGVEVRSGKAQEEKCSPQRSMDALQVMSSVRGWGVRVSQPG